jgi:hypothetical protein
MHSHLHCHSAQNYSADQRDCHKQSRNNLVTCPACLPVCCACCAADITGALKSALPQGSISTGCPITAYKQLEDGTIQLLGPAASSSSGSSEAEVIATVQDLDR